jgi:Holliday junction resolvasome RuvABC endonuclease subunit
MTNKPFKVLAINPGSRYLAIAVFKESELNDWGIKVIRVADPERRQGKIKSLICNLIDYYEPNVLAVKRLHLVRSSANLNRLVLSIRRLARARDIKIYQYLLKDIKTFFSPEDRINKKQLARILSFRYPALWYEFSRERNNKGPYHIRVFEAVGLGAVCAHQLETNNRGQKRC